MYFKNIISSSGKIKAGTYAFYWLGYVLLFTLIQGIGAKNFLTVFYNELFSLIPKILFVFIVVEWLMDKLLLKSKLALFILVYSVLLLFFALVLRLIDNYIILKYFLTTWTIEPLFSSPPFLYNAIKLQFVVTIPFSITLYNYWQKENHGLQAIQFAMQQADISVNTAIETIAASVERPFVFIRCQRRMVKVFLDEILYLEAQRNYLIIYTENEVHKTYQSISEMQDKLPGDLFVRIHRSFIISLSKVKAHTGTYVAIQKKEIPIGRLYSSSIEGILGRI